MIYDHRTYICHPGTMAKQLDLYATYGYDVQKHHLGKPVLYASTDIGELNSYIHIWRYQDITERENRRQAMLADPKWQAYVKRSAEAGYLVGQENRILKDVFFFAADKE